MSDDYEHNPWPGDPDFDGAVTVHLQRRIPPYTERELFVQFRAVGLSTQGATVMAHDMYESNMAEIYRLAKVGEAFERLRDCPTDHFTDFWRGYAAGWNGTQKWVRDHLEEQR